MITKDNFKEVLKKLNFINDNDNNVYTKRYSEFDCELKVDFENQKLIFPKKQGLKVNDITTSNFSSSENFVVFECVDRLLTQGYHPKHIELEKKWPLGHSQKSGKADILVKDNDNNALLIIECKTAGIEYKKAINILESDSRNQLFSYLQQATTTKFLALYTSDFIDDRVVQNYYLINVVDNENFLQNNPKLQGYKDASTAIEKYAVWCETYDKEYATIGLFENNEAYKIGKVKFNIDDLKDISSKDIQGKYHEFATILRQHNVSGRENAFDKLVNLFLCKVTDEKENPNELKFYWKGKTYDDPFDFQDRLQQLYKIGMDKFLDDKIVYIANDKIDEAFGVFKDKPNVTKDLVKKFVKELKFFTNNDFAFIDVHNEKLFYQNFEVLLKIARMIQDIKLTTSEENQFLGDMFESFLDQGIKQSEGQFFTPMPIVKFIINSLPSKENPKVIDYACGAGHFLNEYASENSDATIVGVEKEYRLSKVAKVSSFMYGSDIDIVYADALAKNAKLNDDSFDVLIANPPYSVKGFLQTLSDEDRDNFELIKEVDTKSYSKTGAIECFFIERSKQLLSKDGVAGIIVPSSILNKDTPKLYIKTRELILKYFDIVAIAEFGSGTFGKTGTNTVTLFLKRRSSNPDISIHFKNMVNSWFECDMETNKVFKHSYMLEAYCLYIGIDFELYKSLFCKEIDDRLFENETFKEYKTTFTKKELKKIKFKRGTSKEEKEQKKKQALRDYIAKIEKDKIIYFALTSHQINDVIIVKSPTDNKESKKFLGYEWGGRKGSEGIKYLTKSNLNIKDDNLDENDKRVLENLQGLKYINTPLYNPKDSDDKSKINKIIKDNFKGIKTDIPQELEQFVSRARLVDMLDFSRVEFNKGISLSLSKKVEIESKWKLVRLGDLTELKAGSTPSRANPNYWNNGTIKWLKINDFTDYQEIYDTKEKITKRALEETGVKLLPKDTIIVTIFATVGRVGILKEEMTTNQAIVGLIIKNKSIKNYYLMYAIKFFVDTLINQASGLAQLNINGNILKNMKIPLPPLEIQEEIIQECQKVDDEVLEAEQKIKEAKEEIEKEISSVKGEIVKLSQISKQILAGGDKPTNFSKIKTDKLKIPIYSNSVTNDGLYGYTDKARIIKPSLTISARGTIGFTVARKEPFYPIVRLIVITPKSELVNINYLEKILNFYDFKSNGAGVEQLPIPIVKNSKIPLPELSIQKQIVKKIEKLETKITEAKKIIDNSKELKEEILRKYLQ